MSSVLTGIAIVCSGLFALVLIAELASRRRVKPFLWQLLLLAVLLIAVRTATGYSASSGRQAFGATSPLTAVGLMFGATILGIAARYVFYLQTPFSWLGMLKPVCVTPLVLLPLVGSVQAVSSINSTQLVSFTFLAFQNGFFWHMVLEAARPNVTARPPGAAEAAERR